MKLTNRPKKRIVVCAALALTGLLALTGGSYAAYTSQDAQRGVVRNRDTDAIRFTSNYLQTCSFSKSEYEGRTVIFSKTQTGDTLSLDIYVYNYANGNETLVSQKDISYTMSISFSETGDYSVDGTKVTGGEYISGTKTLRGRFANSHKYTVTFSKSKLDKLKITAVAQPTDSSLTNNQKLAAVIAPCTGVTTQGFSAKGNFTDTSGSPKDYDGFNYEISISNGAATGTLTWDADTIEIDKYFLEKTGAEVTTASTADGKKKTITIAMDQTKGTGDYLIPFYIKDRSKIPASWDEMKKKITFTATQKNVDSTN